MSEMVRETQFKDSPVGRIPVGWEVFQLKNLVNQIIDFRGRTPLKIGMEWGNGSIRSLSANNVKDGYIDFNIESNLGSEELYERWMTQGDTAIGDILFTMEAPLGNVAIIPDNQKYILSQRVILLKILKEKIDGGFIFHTLRSAYFKNQLRKYATGTTALGIQQKRLVLLHLSIPPLDEQKKIASILTSVDQVIEKTESEISKLQDLKKGMMQQLLTQGIGHTQFKDSPVGKIPVEWDFVYVEQIGRVIRGASPRPKGDPRYYGGKVPRLMVADVTRDGKYVTPTTDFLTEEGAKLSRPLDAGSLTIVCSGVVGVPSILKVPACIHDGFLALVEISCKCSKEFLYYYFLPLQNLFDSSATHGGIFTNLTTQILKEFPIALPPLAEQKKITDILTSIDDSIQQQQRELQQTQNLKKSLMQDLLTGKVRVKVD